VGLLLGCQADEIEQPKSIKGIPLEIFLDVLQAEDTRQWNGAMESLLTSRELDTNGRARIALAAGRIGDAAVVPSLVKLLSASEPIAEMAAFALGEIESVSAATALIDALRSSKSIAVRSASVEALGKIAVGLTGNEIKDRNRIGTAILEALTVSENQQLGNAITAAMRARPEGAPKAIARLLESGVPGTRADALNALARLRAKESLDRVRVLLTTDEDPIVRANAARVLGAAEDKSSVDALSRVMTADADSRARVAAIRALASLAQAESAKALLDRAEMLRAAQPPAKNELLEIATALSRILPNSNDERALALLFSLREANVHGPEVETALARIAPERYLNDPFVRKLDGDWRRRSAVAQALAAIGTSDAAPSLKASALSLVRTWVKAPDTPETAMYDVLQAFNVFKPKDLVAVVMPRLKAGDVVIRATVADLLSELPQSPVITKALVDALAATAADKQNDAALSIVGALAKAKTQDSTAALKAAANRDDYLVRRRAIEALNGRPDVTPEAVGPVKTGNSRGDYLRAALRLRELRSWTATLKTDKGDIGIRLDPENAPLTVDNFVQLANAHYFDGLTFHRVVPNFVIQGGDPRGDGNGGPGYTIRCEINPKRYETGAVGMALSGKDTGGSQFFITHSPQPHLDGGYTVFARVVSGQDVVDRIERGDLIQAVVIKEETGRVIY
jgi:cyclophilin family peptidyl-prolyl cis-trans isomerase/HEAT repeat protein